MRPDGRNRPALKVLVWEDAGQVWLGYNDPAWIAKRHEVADCAVAGNIAGALEAMSRAALAAPDSGRSSGTRRRVALSLLSRGPRPAYLRIIRMAFEMAFPLLVTLFFFGAFLLVGHHLRSQRAQR